MTDAIAAELLAIELDLSMPTGAMNVEGVIVGNLKPLVWKGAAMNNITHFEAQGAGIFYRINKIDGNHVVVWHDQTEGSSGNKELKSLDEAKAWVNTDHYPSKMRPYVKPDSITDIRNWFKAAKPEPTDLDKCVQMGCHFEEVAENLVAMNAESEEVNDIADSLKRISQGVSYSEISDFINAIDNLELLGALCDQIVTATGVAYMMGFDIEGALKEVIRSNNSKMVKGKFEFDANGKIAKPESYSKPDLTSFLGGDCANIRSRF